MAIKVMDIRKPNDPKDLTKIQYKYHTVTKQTSKYTKTVYHCDNIITFDIECSSGYLLKDGTVVAFDKSKYDAEFDLPLKERKYQKMIDKAEPQSIMYVWQCGIESADGTPYIFMGRTYSELLTFMTVMMEEIRRQTFFGVKTNNRAGEVAMAMTSDRKVECKWYIHNLSYEYQCCLRNMFNDEFAKKNAKHGAVFAREARDPMKARIMFQKVGLTFTDTLCLTNKSLKTWCKDANIPEEVRKLDEDQEFYEEIRLPNTPLTDEVIAYSCHDVLCMLYLLEQYRDKYGHLIDIPLTKTGEIRKICRERTWAEDPDYCRECADIHQTYTPDLYRALISVYSGGWTHGNCYAVSSEENPRTHYNILQFDMASFYPSVMVTRRYAMTPWTEAPITDFWRLEKQDVHTADERWMALIEIGPFVSNYQNSFWSFSKCIEGSVKNPIKDNGRLVSAHAAKFWITDLDWNVFKHAYNFDDSTVKVIKVYKSYTGYLSTSLIKTILECFQKKTSYKNRGPEFESMYKASKEVINSIYGVACTKLVHKDVVFTGKSDKPWEVVDDWTDEEFYKTMKKVKPEETFLTFSTGCWVTAWCRYILWTYFIMPMDTRTYYCDTDSFKGKYTDKDIKYIEKFNKEIVKLENKVAKDIGIDPSLYTAYTVDGELKRIGVAEREDDARAFRTLGAKKYVEEVFDKKKGEWKIVCTIAGLPKDAGPKMIKSVDDFTKNTFWNTSTSGKLIACYNDKQHECTWRDSFGNTYVNKAKYGLCLKPTTFGMDMREFEAFLTALANGEVEDDMPKYLREDIT